MFPNGSLIDNLLFWRRRFFQRNTAFSPEILNDLLQYDVKIFSDKYRVRERQL